MEACAESRLGDLFSDGLIGDVLKVLKAEVGGAGLAAQVRYPQLAHMFRAAGLRLGLAGLPGLHRLRHGGASADLAGGWCASCPAVACSKKIGAILGGRCRPLSSARAGP